MGDKKQSKKRSRKAQERKTGNKKRPKKGKHKKQKEKKNKTQRRSRKKKQKNQRGQKKNSIKGKTKKSSGKKKRIEKKRNKKKNKKKAEKKGSKNKQKGKHRQQKQEYSNCTRNLFTYSKLYTKSQNLIRKILRSQRFANRTKTKGEKKLIFSLPYKLLLNATGNNLSSPRCNGKPSDSAIVKTLTDLGNCNKTIGEECETNPPALTNQTLETCITTLTKFNEEYEECMRIFNEGVCTCIEKFLPTIDKTKIEKCESSTSLASIITKKKKCE